MEGCIAPAGIVTEVGEMDTIPELLLASDTTRPPLGAGAESVTWNGADWPRPTLTFDGNANEPPL